MRTRALLACALWCAATAAACRGEDPVPALEARRAALLAATVPKKDFWDEVQRKGAALKARQDLEAEARKLASDRARGEAELAALEAQLARARDAALAAEADLARLIAAADAARAERRARAAVVRDFETRRREPAP